MARKRETGLFKCVIPGRSTKLRVVLTPENILAAQIELDGERVYGGRDGIQK